MSYMPVALLLLFLLFCFVLFTFNFSFSLYLSPSVILSYSLSLFDVFHSRLGCYVNDWTELFTSNWTWIEFHSHKSSTLWHTFTLQVHIHIKWNICTAEYMDINTNIVTSTTMVFVDIKNSSNTHKRTHHITVVSIAIVCRMSIFLDRPRK